LRFPRHRPCYPISGITFPLSGFGPLSGCHRRAPQACCQSEDRPQSCAFRGLSPCDVFPATGSDACVCVRGCTRSADAFASSGFRTLSTLCSPRNLPSLFHPGPVFGVRPSRPSLRIWRRTSLSTAWTLKVSNPTPKSRIRLARALLAKHSLPTGRVIHPRSASICLPGLAPSRLPAPHCCGPIQTRLPLTRFRRFGRKLTSSWAPQGSTASNVADLSRDQTCLLGVFHLVRILGLRNAARTGLPLGDRAMSPWHLNPVFVRSGVPTGVVESSVSVSA
jgi:hypothetical protein